MIQFHWLRDLPFLPHHVTKGLAGIFKLEGHYFKTCLCYKLFHDFRIVAEKETKEKAVENKKAAISVTFVWERRDQITGKGDGRWGNIQS